jgi:hypothetical protein
VIRHRLDLYHEQTVAKYAERGILTQVDGIGGIEEVTDRVMKAIKANQTTWPGAATSHTSQAGACVHVVAWFVPVSLSRVQHPGLGESRRSLVSSRTAAYIYGTAHSPESHDAF